MQSRYTSRLSRKLASYARNHSLSQTAIRYRIYDPDGRPSRQLVRLLINGYEPRKPETRTRLGLPLRIRLPRLQPTDVLLENVQISDQPLINLRNAFLNRQEQP